MKIFFRVFDLIEEVVMVLGVLTMVVVNFLNVIMRYLVPKFAFSFTEELTVFLFVWVTMFGIAYAYKRNAHTGLTLFTDMMPVSFKKVFVIFGALASLVFLGVLFHFGVQMVLSQIKYNQIMTALKIPEAVGGFSIPVGSFIIIIRVIQKGVLDYMRLSKQGKEDGKREAKI